MFNNHKTSLYQIHISLKQQKKTEKEFCTSEDIISSWYNPFSYKP